MNLLVDPARHSNWVSTAAEMDPMTALTTIYGVIKSCKDMEETATKNKLTAKDILQRLFVFEPRLAAIKIAFDQGRLPDPAQRALVRLCEAVCAAELWINKHLQPKTGGVLTWASGRWNAADNKEELRDIAERIDRAVTDLTFTETQAHTSKPENPTPCTQRTRNQRPKGLEKQTLNPSTLNARARNFYILTRHHLHRGRGIPDNRKPKPLYIRKREEPQILNPKHRNPQPLNPELPEP
jgi:hypothetical protein